MFNFNINNPNILEIIRKYLLEELPERDRIAFEKAMQEDKALADEVALMKELQLTLKGRRRAETKAMLEEITAELNIKPDRQRLKQLEELSSIPPASGFPIATLLKIIAGGIFIAALWWLLFPLTPSITHSQQLFREYYSPFPLVEAYNPQSNDPIEQALSAYGKANYVKVISLLKDFPSQTKEMDLLMALGISYIESGDLSQAEKVLEVVSKDTIDIYADDAKWYLALTFLKQEKMKDAQRLLESLQQHDTYGPDVRKILQELSFK